MSALATKTVTSSSEILRTPAAIYESIKNFKINAAVEYYARVYGLTKPPLKLTIRNS